MAGGTTNSAAEQLGEAHRALLADPAIQFAMGPVAPPPKPPAWVEMLGRFLARVFAPIGRFFAWLLHFLPAGPWASILLWTVLGLLAVALVAMIAIRLRDSQWRWPRRRRLPATGAMAPEETWVPEAGGARALLAEADALARAGRFAEAVHLLLQRSVEDIGRRRPALVRPALTSRDLAAADAIPTGARALFAGIAALVERSLFGGRPVGDGDWQQARAAYADFALPRAWSGR